MRAGTIPITDGDGLFGSLVLQPADALLALIGDFRNDPRSDKIDLGVGVYRDSHGIIPVFRAVKDAEHRLLKHQATKGYLGSEGDVGYVDVLKRIVFGARDYGDGLSGLQTPGGTGALRLAAELIRRARPGARIWMGNPTWPRHAPILNAAGLPFFVGALASIR